MEVKAALAYEAGNPLVIKTLQLAGPRAGEVLPEIALAKIREDAPFDKVCSIGCGVTTGIGAVITTAKVEAGANVIVFGLGAIGLNVIQGARPAREFESKTR